ncbi:hypothetical protein KVP06_12010 [Geobacter sulfurreducens]|uniref:Lipoprotein, putative n=1 Tax=Geobacter sulfurreducens (strain ATCC 51573 / DSM 12127 / PCA) TaxID=243231 RepID=I7FIH6_GEOSL|nr:lipoprotein [Geobacter sulfurreducens]AFP20473.1 lipoprotein, putative [Geobacter sulfurreducens PCA]UAC03097.1 hypothetical protein KVP06_12010 [Geobacter sulfurreducens]UTG91743.1 hypothetical protein J8622_11965 [Geobacter sulfurreducens]
MPYRKLLLIGLCLVLLCGCRHGSASVPKEDSNDLDVHGADVNGLDDPLESKVEITTGSKGLMFSLRGGQFYRGYFDKKSKIPTYQLYVRFHSNQWMNWDTAKYLTLDGLKESPVIRVGTDVKCSQYSCGHYEDVILKLDRSTLDKWKTTNTTVRFSSSTVTGSSDIELDSEDTTNFINAMDAVEAYYSRSISK